MVVLALAIAATDASGRVGPAHQDSRAADDVRWCGGSSLTLTGDEARTIALHARQRAADGLPAFCVHPALVRAARGHAVDMLARGYFSHAAPEGVTVDGRVRRAGYGRWRFVAENIGWGNGSLRHPERIFARWMTSPGHRANIRDAELREIGAGVAYGTVRARGTAREYRGAHVYVVNFGTRRAPAVRRAGVARRPSAG